MAATTAVNEAAIDELTAIGRRQGRLRLDDVKRVLPVDRMSADELAATMARLEESGIDVDLDPDLLRPRHDAAAPPATAPAAAPSSPPEPATPGAARHSIGSVASAGGGRSGHVYVYPAEPATAGSKPRGMSSADTIVLGVVIAVCIILILLFAA